VVRRFLLSVVEFVAAGRIGVDVVRVAVFAAYDVWFEGEVGWIANHDEMFDSVALNDDEAPPRSDVEWIADAEARRVRVSWRWRANPASEREAPDQYGQTQRDKKNDRGGDED
jgi:hypothetical protein